MWLLTREALIADPLFCQLRRQFDLQSRVAVQRRPGLTRDAALWARPCHPRVQTGNRVDIVLGERPLSEVLGLGLSGEGGADSWR